MASPVAYAYEPNTDVYVIHSCGSNEYVTQGEVIRIRIEVITTETTINYDIRLNGQSGTTVFSEADVFADKIAAMAEYDNRV